MIKIYSKIVTNIKYLYFKLRYRDHKNLYWPGKQCTKVAFEMAPNGNAELSEHINFRPRCAIRIRDNANLKIGENVNFSDNCILTCRNEISIGNNVMFGPNTIIYDHDHDFRSDDFINNFVVGKIIIEDNVWVGANVCILKNAHIKTGAVIAAGSVVNGIVESNCIYYNKRIGIQKKYK